MRNLFVFIRRYSILLFFVVLQGFALWMLFQYNRYHHTAFLGVANEATGSINTQVDKVDDYFNLREENRRVHRMNDSLINEMKANFWVPDTTEKFVTDTLTFDSTKAVRRYLWREAKVVYNTTGFEKNYLQINRGSDNDVKENMAVLSSDGALIGLIVTVSKNFSQAMSLLHIQSRVPASLKKSNVLGTVEWDGKNARMLTLKGISKDVDLKRGDSVVTSIYSYNYPPGFLIGTIASVKVDKASGFYLLKVKTAANFAAVQNVFLVENLQRTEQLLLEEETRNKIEQQKRN